MVSVDWPNKIINITQSDLTNLGNNVYSLNLNDFRLTLKDLEDGEGMPFSDTHRHVSTTTVGGVTLARLVEIINGYTVTFEDGQYAVNLVGANSNISDVTNVNQVSIRAANTAGLVQVSSGSGLSTEQATQLTQLAATLQESGIFSAQSLTNAPSNGTFTDNDRAILTTTRDNTTTLLSRLSAARATALDLLQGISDRVFNLLKGLGRVDGVSVEQSDPTTDAPGFIRSSDGEIDQELTVDVQTGKTTIRNR